jgi:hypothetical protein
MYGVIVSESSMYKYNIFADPLCFEIKNRRQGPKTAGYRRKPAAISNPVASSISGGGTYSYIRIHRP